MIARLRAFVSPLSPESTGTRNSASSRNCLTDAGHSAKLNIMSPLHIGFTSRWRPAPRSGVASGKQGIAHGRCLRAAHCVCARKREQDAGWPRGQFQGVYRPSGVHTAETLGWARLFSPLCRCTARWAWRASQLLAALALVGDPCCQGPTSGSSRQPSGPPRSVHMPCGMWPRASRPPHSPAT